LPLFPVIAESRLEPRFLEWLFVLQPERRPDFTKLWRELPRLAAQEIGERVNLKRLYEQRARFRQSCLAPLIKNFRWSVFFKLDLEATAKTFAAARRRCRS